MQTKGILISLLMFFVFNPFPTFGWSEHPMIIYPILKDIPDIVNAAPVEVKSLQQFLMEEEQGIAGLLAGHELFARDSLSGYVPRPDVLKFNATGNSDDVLQRFFSAIRINPNVKTALYLQLLPGEHPGNREIANPYSLTTLTKLYEMLHTTYVRINEGELVAPMYVLATATDEPDYGLDLDLFEDNNTPWGLTYGFGEQSFGNPDLEYSTQAPFHMGFYHESWIVFAAAPFLKKTFVEYRIHLYKTLAAYAFEAGQPYWAYRFLGWATHYLNDMSMPYHTSVMPAKGSLQMIWINLKSMLGFPRSVDNAIQLLSNRHTVYEQFQWLVLRKAHLDGNKEHPFLIALANPIENREFNDAFARKVASRESARISRKSDRKLRKFVPAYLVSDPKHSINSSEELDDLLTVMKNEKGEDAIAGMTDMIAERFSALSMHTRSFLDATLPRGVD